MLLFKRIYGFNGIVDKEFLLLMVTPFFRIWTSQQQSSKKVYRISSTSHTCRPLHPLKQAHHHHHCIFVFLEEIMLSTVFIQAFLSLQIFSRLSRSFSWSSDRLMLEYLEISLRIMLSHVVFRCPADLFHVFTKAFSDLLAGVSEGNRSRWPNHNSLLLHIIRLHRVTLVRL